MIKKIAALAALIGFIWGGTPRYVTRGASPLWWVTGPTIKVTAAVARIQSDALTNPAQPFELDAARQEYAPFQIVFWQQDGQAILDKLDISPSADHFDIKLYKERFVPILSMPPDTGDIFTVARLKDKLIPDGLQSFTPPFGLTTNTLSVFWVDVYVRADTPPGNYTLNIDGGSLGTQQVKLKVYPVDLVATPSMNVIVPIEPNYTMPFYGGSNANAFQHAVNNMLVAHDLIPGSLVAQPQITKQGWDFSPLNAELDALPPGAMFYAPPPYSARMKQYLLHDANGQPYQTTNFDDPNFVAQAKAYFAALADYLKGKNRLDGALIYPVDESRWVGDEPLHNGPDGFDRLEKWTQLAHAAGLHVIASGVTPVAPGPTSLGWIDPAQVTDISHVDADIFDAAPQLYADWSQTPDHQAGLYLNYYGDMIDMPASIHRGLLWHAYGRGVRLVAGYAAMQWVDKSWNLVDPWSNIDQVFPQVGYGVGALIWPGPSPSIRLKLLREGVEDMRLLDLYAQATSAEQARTFATCLTPGSLSDATPDPDIWDRAHTALLQAISSGQPVQLDSLCAKPPTQRDMFPIINNHIANNWNANDAKVTIADSGTGGPALQVDFDGQAPEVGLGMLVSDWRGWSTLKINVKSDSPYFTELNVALTDSSKNFLMLRHGVVIIGPDTTQTVILPLTTPPGTYFDWGHITYLSLQVNTTSRQTDSSNQKRVYPLGPRQLTFTDFVLVK